MDNNIKTITTWSKSKQASIISDIASKYPTAKEFKAAILQNGDDKSKQLVQSMDENMPRAQYIDYLQHVFIKHSKAGKILANSLIGLGVGAAAAYLLGKEAEKRATRHQISKETNIKYDPITDKVDILNSDPNAIKNSNVGKLTSKVYNDIHSNPLVYGSKIDNAISKFKNSINTDPVTTWHNTKTFGKDILSSLNDPELVSRIKNDYHNGSQNILGLATKLGTSAATARGIYDNIDKAGKIGKYTGGAVGMAAGGLGSAKISDIIQNWNEKKHQNKIDSLKYSK